MELVQKINLSEEDHLYILGDALDRGPEPMKVILDILSRKNITYIIGNHDYLFLYFIRKLGLNLSQTENMSKEDIEKKIWADIKEINSTLTTYKHMKKLIISTEPMVKTTTNKVKRNIEIAKTLEEMK